MILLEVKLILEKLFNLNNCLISNRLMIVASGSVIMVLPLRSKSKFKGKVLRVLQRGWVSVNSCDKQEIYVF